MKFIFDFDDVLFLNTKKFKEHMYSCLEQKGASRREVEVYYEEMRGNEFSPKKLISALFPEIEQEEKEKLYEEIMASCQKFANEELLTLVQKIGRDNCYIVSNGQKEFQSDKIRRSGAEPLASKIYIVPGSKKDVITDICNRHETEKIVFVEDKIKFIEDLNFDECQNLKTVLFDEHGLERLKAEAELVE